jgi:adenylosuccinate synthase
MEKMHSDGVNPDIYTTPMSLSDTLPYGLNELGEVFGHGEPRGAWCVFGGQAGSEGKGAIAGYLARKHRWGAAACTFMTNAGHTWIGEDGAKVVVQQLPVGLVSPDVGRLFIGAGSAITLDQLFKEIEQYDAEYDVTRRLGIHPRAVIIEESDVLWEADTLRYIASTGKGCGSALARKAMRPEGIRLARDVPELREFLEPDMTLILNRLINTGSGVLVEAAQGFDLDINHGVEYPYCTSRGTTPMQVMADLGIDGRMVMRNIAVIRSFPIRVGNVEGGTSGPYGSSETSWQEISQHAGREVEERTTVTDRVRRVFEMDYARLGYMSEIARPTDIALTFADYVEPSVANTTKGDWTGRALPGRVQDVRWQVEKAMRRSVATPKVRLIKTGPMDHHIIDHLGAATVI